jgi:hypothetical protein
MSKLPFQGLLIFFSFPTTQMIASITLLELCYSSHSEYSKMLSWILAIANIDMESTVEMENHDK